MKQLFIMAVAAGLLAALSVQQAYAQYGDSIPMGQSSGTGVSEEMLQRCAGLGIPTTQCNDITILAKERVLYTEQTRYGNDPGGSGTPYFQGAETLGVIGILGAVFGGIAGVFFLMGRRARQVPA